MQGLLTGLQWESGLGRCGSSFGACIELQGFVGIRGFGVYRATGNEGLEF